MRIVNRSFLYNTWTNREFYFFCIFWLFVAFLEFIQDYISAYLNGNSFIVSESAFYKFFWILFIPLTILLHFTYLKFSDRINGKKKPGKSTVFFLFSVSLPIFTSLVHLLLFALFLSGMAKLINDDQWPLSWLIREKLATRLYISISIYALISYLIYRSHKKRKNKDHEVHYASVLPVKNGSRSVIVEMENIRWIKSDGAYLELHTGDKKHVIVSSLKSLIPQLNPEQFKRIHKSTIVNLKMISAFKSRLNGDYDVILTDGTTLRLSRNYAKPLKGSLI